MPKTDPLKRLEKWLKRKPRGRYAQVLSGSGRGLRGFLFSVIQFPDVRYTGQAKTIPAAISAALDQAESRR